jgi:hypothetical protein
MLDPTQLMPTAHCRVLLSRSPQWPQQHPRSGVEKQQVGLSLGRALGLGLKRVPSTEAAAQGFCCFE